MLWRVSLLRDSLKGAIALETTTLEIARLHKK